MIPMKTNVGLRINFEPFRGITFSVENRWKNRIGGLCGNYNDDGGDEFMTRLGFVTVKAGFHYDSFRLVD